ncbi:MAG: hypothetical protein ACYTJ0_19065 [Planctomycetota bacterium]|jgi:hypothetical protein
MPILLLILALADAVAPPDAELRRAFELAPFYAKHVDVEGFPVLSSEGVDDVALLEAAFVVRQMIGHRPDVLRAMAEGGTRLVVMAPTEMTTAVPEHSDLAPKAYWDKRARGLGATRQRPAVSCGEENLLGYPGDPYRTESILVHEFAHAIHEMGLLRVDEGFDARLRSAYEKARAAGRWAGTYAATNDREYWAEGVQCWFDTNREDDHDHNHVDTRAELREYDPALAALCAEVFGADAWRYVHPLDRQPGDPGTEHLRGYDPAKAPRFAWPAEVLEAWRAWQAEQRSP